MTATLTLVPLDKIKPGDGFNPRNEFAEEPMTELVASVRRHGIITPLTLAPAEDGCFTIIAGERRYRAAKAAKRERAEQQARAEREARVEAQRAKLAAGEPIRCEFCFGPIESPEAAVEKDGTLVHAGDCARDWGSAAEVDEDAEDSK